MENKQMKCVKGESCLHCGSNYCRFVDELDQLKATNEQAEQKLEKIREIANGMHDMWINKTQYTDVYNLAEHLLKCELNRIINKI